MQALSTLRILVRRHPASPAGWTRGPFLAGLAAVVSLSGCGLTGPPSGYGRRVAGPAIPLEPAPAAPAATTDSAPAPVYREDTPREASAASLAAASDVGGPAPNFGDPRAWPADPATARHADRQRQPDLRDGDNLAALPGLYGEIYDGPPLDRERSDGPASVRQVTAEEIGFTLEPSISRDGAHLVYVSDRHGEAASIYVQRTSGRTIQRITSPETQDCMPVFSPDGREIAFASRRNGTYDIHVVAVTGGAVTRITSTPDDALHPSFSPDGRRIAYCRLNVRSGRWELWMTDRDTGQETFLDYGLFPEWNPDPGQASIVYQQARERDARYFGVWMIELVDGDTRSPIEIVSAANAACMHPTWSPDGTRLAFVTVSEPELRRDGRPAEADIWVVDADGRNRIQLTGGGSANLQPAWAMDGTIYFASNRSGWDNIWSIRDAATLPATSPVDGRLTRAESGDSADGSAAP